MRENKRHKKKEEGKNEGHETRRKTDTQKVHREQREQTDNQLTMVFAEGKRDSFESDRGAAGGGASSAGGGEGKRLKVRPSTYRKNRDKR